MPRPTTTPPLGPPRSAPGSPPGPPGTGPAGGDLPAPGARPPSTAASTITSVLPGAAAALACSGACVLLATRLPTLPALLAALLLGVLLRAVGALPARLDAGLAWTARRVLRTGVVLLGLQLSIGDLLHLGAREAAVLVVTVATTFSTTLWLGRRLGVRDPLTLLVATGFSICGAAAVAAMSPVADADEDDVATAVALVTLFGSLAIVLVPVLAAAAGLDDRTAGLWAGMSVHEVAQVVAAAGSISATALAVAVVAKLARVVLLAPLVAGTGLVRRRRAGVRPGAPRTALVPLFVVGFVVAVVVRSVGVVPDGAVPVVKFATTLALGAAMTALGTQIHLGRLVRTGGRPLVLGAGATVVAMGVSLGGLLLVT